MWCAASGRVARRQSIQRSRPPAVPGPFANSGRTAAKDFLPVSLAVAVAPILPARAQSSASAHHSAACIILDSPQQREHHCVPRTENLRRTPREVEEDRGAGSTQLSL